MVAGYHACLEPSARVSLSSMASPRWLLAALAPLAVAACADAPEGWTRVLATTDYDGNPRYRIVYADPIADTCVRLELSPATAAVIEDQGTQDGEVDVAVQGLDGIIVRYAVGGRPHPDYPDDFVSRDCTTRAWTSDVGPPEPRLSGKMTWREFASASDPAGPCRVDFELEVHSLVFTYNDATGEFDESEDIYEIAARDVGIYAEGCPHPGDAEVSFAELDAAYAELDGLGTVVVSSWDPIDEVCAWVRLFSSADALEGSSEVEVDGGWVYAGVRVAAIEREACAAAQLVDPIPIAIEARLSSSAGPLGSVGSVGFGATATKTVAAGSVDAPCSLDLDLRANSYADYYWVPDIVTMRASAVEVAGACD